MQMKKILSASIAIAMIATSALGVMAEDAETEVVTNEIVGNNIVGTATEDVTANFTYDATADASATVTVDVDENAKTVALEENFDSLEVGSAYESVNVGPATGSLSYDGVAGVTAPVVDNPARDTEGDNCISITHYFDSRFNIYDGTSYDATFWMRARNTLWDGINIQVKPDVYLAYRGTSLTANGDADGLGLYIGYSACGNNPAAEVEKGSAECIAYANLYDEYNYAWTRNEGYYWRIVTTYNSVKVYINTVNDFTNASPIIDATLTGDKVDERSILQFSQANTDLWVDDVVIKEIGTVPAANTTGSNGLLVKDIDFQGTTLTAPVDTTYSVNNTDGFLLMNSTGDTPRDAVLVSDVQGDYVATFWFKGANPRDDRFRIRIRDNYYLHIRGTNSHGGTIKDAAGNNAYGIAIINGSGIWGASFLASAALPTNANDGYWTKIELVDNTVKVWMVQTASFTGEFTGDPLINYTIEDRLSPASPFAFANRNSSGVYFDDLKIVSANKGSEGKLVYANDYDMYTCGTTNAVLTTINADTGNVALQKGTASGTQWNTTSLFTAPENYEMTFQVGAGNNAYNQASIYLKNKIRIRFMGTATSGSSVRELWLVDDNNTAFKMIYTVGSAGDILHDLPFTSGYMKVIFKGAHLQVYMSKNANFANSYKIFEHTFENLETTDKTIRVASDNTLMTYDNFKVYDLDYVDNTNIGAGYKQVVLSGTDVKLVDVVDGVATELGSYTLPVAGARYRISVAKANGKLTVYVNGKAAIETDSTAAGLMFFEGANDPVVVNGTAAPTVISAGDLNYSEGVDATDLLMMKKILLGLDKVKYITEAVNADGDADLTIDIRDFIRIKKIMAGVA